MISDHFVKQPVISFITRTLSPIWLLLKTFEQNIKPQTTLTEKVNLQSFTYASLWTEQNRT